MSILNSDLPSFLAAFMASTVEFVEALTIVLAVGAMRGWRSALSGTGTALMVLLALVGLLGPSLTRIPLPLVQLVVGTLLLLFGLRWLRKAILRAAGVIALHDEAHAFAKQTAELGRRDAPDGRRIDAVAFFTAFKIVMLEGIEVVFIVIAIGASGRMLLPASLGAIAALLLVATLGLIVHRPLARVPENTLKFGVGAMLAAFGTFWVGEGIGFAWPGADWTLAGLIAAYVALGLCLVAISTSSGKSPHPQRPAMPVAAKPARGWVAAVWVELIGLFVDDGVLAAGAVLCVLAAWLVEAQRSLHFGRLDLLFAAGLMAVLAASTVRRARS